jgi:hypothetical protein
MTFDEADAAGKVALCQLPGGAQLRYDPSDGSVLRLPYPGIPGQWREASAYHHPLPPEGWTHYRGCDCPACAAERERSADTQELASA